MRYFSIIAPRLHHAPALDGLRAIAVAAVLLFHAGVTWLPGGFLGVDVFFVLSGYLITSLLLAEHGSSARIDLARFWLRRARRLLPAVVLVVLAGVLISLTLPVAEASLARGDALPSLLYFNNWHQILGEQSYFAAVGRPSPLRHLWSLSVEEQFYLLWPLAMLGGLARLGRPRLLRAILAGALGSGLLMALLYDPSNDPSRVYYGTDTRATTLLLGAALAFVWPLRPVHGPTGRRSALFLDSAALLGLGLVTLAFLRAHEYDAWLYRGGLALIAAASAVLIAAVVHPACRIGRALGAPPLRWVGDRSYGIYLWHWPVMVLTRPGLDVSWSPWILVPAQIAVTVALAAASYRWVEMPFRTGAAQTRVRAWLGRRTPHHRLAIVSSGALAAILAGVWMASAPAAPVPRVTHTPAARAVPQPVRTPAVQGPPLAVGASVMLGAEQALRNVLGADTVVDAEVGRWPADIDSRLEAYRASKSLPSRVVVQMGENGPIRDEDIQRLRAVLEGVTRVVIVNVRVPRAWEQEVNDKLQQAVADWPQAVMANWRAAARGDLLYGDGIHPTPEGRQVYAAIVARALERPAAEG